MKQAVRFTVPHTPCDGDDGEVQHAEKEMQSSPKQNSKRDAEGRRSIFGKTFYVHGATEDKSELEEFIRSLGGIITGSLRENTNYFVATKKSSEELTREMEIALDYNISIIDEEYLWQAGKGPTPYEVVTDADGVTRRVYDSRSAEHRSPSAGRRPRPLSWNKRPPNPRRKSGLIQNLRRYPYDHSRGTSMYDPDSHYNDVDSVSEVSELDNLDDFEDGTPNELSVTTSAYPQDYPPPAPPREDLEEHQQERIEWQNMLSSVLTGELVRTEKRRLQDMPTDQRSQAANLHYEIWLDLRAMLRARKTVDEKRIVDAARRHIDPILEKVLHFRVQDGDRPALEQVKQLLDQVDRLESLYPSRHAFMQDKPLYGSDEFQNNLDALNAWYTLTCNLQQQLQILKTWTGSDDLKFAEPKEANTSSQHGQGSDGTPSFIERILKENNLQRTLEKRTLFALNQLLRKAKETMKQMHQAFDKMKLPPFKDELLQLITFPTELVEGSIKLRLGYSKRINEPTMLIVDQMMEDFRTSLNLGYRIKRNYEELLAPSDGWDLPNCIDEQYDSVLLSALRYFFKLLQWKLKGESKAIFFKEAEILEEEWNFLSNVSPHIEGAELETAEHFCSLTNRLLIRLVNYYDLKLRMRPNEIKDLFKWFSRVLENVRLRGRKLMRFTRVLTSQLENMTEFQLNISNFNDFIASLVASDHVFVYTGSLEQDGIYVIASPGLYEDEQHIRRMLRSCFLKYSEYEKDDAYLIVLSPKESFVWSGYMINVPIERMNVDMKPNRVRLIAGTAMHLHETRQRIFEIIGNPTMLELVHEQRSHLTRLNRELNKVKKTLLKLVDVIMNSICTLRSATKGLQAQDLLEECFSFATDFGQRAAKFLDQPARHQLNLKLLRLAIDWVGFICDDCVATDRKTFRWAVIALEYAMVMTRGSNVLELTDEEFDKLQIKVANCMTLLISHFDVLGSRTSQAEIGARTDLRAEPPSTSQAIRGLQAGGHEENAVGGENSIMYIRDEWVRQIRELDERRTRFEQEHKWIGMILDDERPEDRSLMSLAPSASSISFKWQQGKFLGSGTFGSVFLAINVDSGALMAVKEIRYQDTQQLSALHRSIREEMRVMQMMHHPNIVQYYGMECHRNKVLIFMEYCENGSLANLLEHGRIDDEAWIILYAYQMLLGLAYLHDNNIVHRDIKPDNVLLDHYGRLKFVDFGAAKILAKNQKTLGRTTMNPNVNSLTGTPMYMSPEVITGSDKGRKGAMDIWSLGCCVLEMATGRRPWSNLDNEWAIMYHVVTGHPPLPDPSLLSELGMDFLQKCFIRSPHERPTARELLEHPWFQTIDIETALEQPWTLQQQTPQQQIPNPLSPSTTLGATSLDSVMINGLTPPASTSSERSFNFPVKPSEGTLPPTAMADPPSTSHNLHS
ncbi:uncharacterized protein VTP21DRAFT_3720 [Calcarisporiella thermophila]|uniref:uncharacterized protein n=1 Tax=Calcarisporiella thermophila TaxID=911321 RepID=UPI003742F7F9